MKLSFFERIEDKKNNWGEPERAPPRALQRLRSLSHGGISYVLPNAHAQSLRGQHFQV